MPDGKRVWMLFDAEWYGGTVCGYCPESARWATATMVVSVEEVGIVGRVASAASRHALCRGFNTSQVRQVGDSNDSGGVGVGGGGGRAA